MVISVFILAAGFWFSTMNAMKVIQHSYMFKEDDFYYWAGIASICLGMLAITIPKL